MACFSVSTRPALKVSSEKNPAVVPDEARWSNWTHTEGSSLPSPDTTGPPDKTLTYSEAAERLGIRLSTLRRLVRDGTLWPTPDEKRRVGITESEVQRFIDRFEKPAQKGLPKGDPRV